MKKTSFSLLIIVTFIFVNISFANTEVDEDSKHPLHSFAVISDALPYEIELMIGHLKTQSLTQEQLEIVVTRSRQINNDLRSVEKKALMFLLKSETYKGILTSQYLNLKNKLQISATLYKTAKQKLEKHNLIYSDFSTWIIEALLKDFTPYVRDGFINRYQSIKRSDSKGLLRARKLLKILKYNSPLLESFLTRTPERFNQLSTNIVIDIFDRISKKSYYFLTYQGKLSKVEESILFSIPELQVSSPQVSPLIPKSIKDESRENLEEAQKAVKALDVEDMSDASEKIDNILE
jgi:hypothetical protein